MKSWILCMLAILPLPAQTITWTDIISTTFGSATTPYGRAWLHSVYDSQHKLGLYWMSCNDTPSNNPIYSDCMWSWDSANHNFTKLWEYPAPAQWSSTTTYSTNQSVTYTGYEYISLVNNNLNNTPPASGGTNSFWQGNVCNTTVLAMRRHPYGQADWDSSANRLFQYDGVCGSQHQLDTIAFTHSGTTNSGSWTSLAPTHNNDFGGQNDATMVYDPVHDAMWMLGGDTANGGFPTNNVFVFCKHADPQSNGDTIGCTNGANDWTQVTVSGTLTGVQNHIAAWIGSNTILVYGGVVQGPSNSNTVYRFNVTSHAWSTDTTTGTAPSTADAYAYGAWDNSRSELLVIIDSTHEFLYTPSTKAWSSVTVAGTPPNPAGFSPDTTNLGCTVLYDQPNDRYQAECETDGTPTFHWYIGVPPPPPAQTVQMTVQEAIYNGSTAGVTRTSYPVTTSVPFPDSAAILASGAQMTLTGGPTYGQFRCLSQWPSGNCKWMQVDTLVSLSAGGNTTFTATNQGIGNFGGSNVCSDPGGTSNITCATGSATFQIKKANFNGLDSVVIGSTTVVASSNADNHGIVVLGPASPGTSCGTCTTVFSTRNDANSTSVLEENGPVRSVVKTIADLKDSSGNVYMHVTVRQYFYVNDTHVRVVTTLRNADYGTSSTFATAFKGHQGFEYRIPANITGTLNYAISNESGTPTTGTLNQGGGTDYAYLYAGETQALNDPNWCAAGGTPTCVPWTSDIGFSIVNNGTVLRGGGSTVSAVSKANPAVVTLTGSVLSSSLLVNGGLRLIGATGTGCSGINTPAYSSGVSPGPNQTGFLWPITNINGQNVTITYDASGCTYTANSATAYSDTQYPQGWADIANSSGVGITIGVYQFAAFAPKSLEFRNGGADVRIGIWAAENSQPYYASWPGWQISDQYLNFHASQPTNAALSNAFLSYQHYLVGRAAVSTYNSAGVFEFPMTTALEEDTAYFNAWKNESLPQGVPATITSATNASPIVVGFATAPAWQTGQTMVISGGTGNTAVNGTWVVTQTDSMHYSLNGSTGNGTYGANSASARPVNELSASNSCCLWDRGLPTDSRGYHLDRYYYWPWHQGSATNQMALDIGDLQAFLKRGGGTDCLSGNTLTQCSTDPFGSLFAGRYLDFTHWARFLMETGWPHADGFTWRSKSTAELDQCGQPTATSANSSLGMQLWQYCANLEEHWHWYGLILYYYLTGDQNAYDAMVGFPNSFPNPGTTGGGLKDLFLNQQLTQTSGFYGKGPTGTHAATVAGGTVNLSMGDTFPTPAGTMVGYPIVVGASNYTVTAQSSSTQITVTPDPGNQTGPLNWAYDGGLFNTRSVGHFLIGASRFYTFLKSASDTDAANVLAQGARLYLVQVKGDLCVGPGGTIATSFPTGCVIGTTNSNSASSWHTQGVSRVRGLHWGNAGVSFQSNCAATTGPSLGGRGWSLFFNNNLLQGVWELLVAEGSTWTEYQNARDLAYGVSQAMLGEGFAYDGTPAWYNFGVPFNSNGYRYALFLDYGNLCNLDMQGFQGSFEQTIWMPFYVQQQVLGQSPGVNQTKFNIALQRAYAATSGPLWSEYGNYGPAQAIYALDHPGANALQPLTPSVVENSGCAMGLGAGNYCVTWTTPTGTTELHVKYGCLLSACGDGKKTFVDYIGYDSGNNVFVGNPVTTLNWFAGQNAPSIPAPVAGSQSMVVNTGLTGMTAANFSVKAMSPSSTPVAASVLSGGTTSGVVR